MSDTVNINQKDRDTLKSYFVKNAIPSEQDYADVLDGMLNQKTDRVIKEPDGPLSLEAAGEVVGPRPVLHLYHQFDDPGPTWSLSMNPRSVVSDPDTARQGLSIHDRSGLSRLFIDETSGHVGLGRLDPQSRLHVAGDARVDGSLHIAGGTSLTGAVNVAGGPVEVAGHVKCTTLEVSDIEETWIQPTLLNGWSNLDAGTWGPIRYCKDRFGWVHFAGELKTGTGNNKAVFVLEPGYWPEYTLLFRCIAANNGTANVRVKPDGTVVAGTSGLDYSHVGLSNCHFKAFQ